MVSSRKSMSMIGVTLVTLLLASSGIGLARASWLFPSMHVHFPTAPAANLLAHAHRQLFNQHTNHFDTLWNEMLEQQLTALQCQKHCTARAQRTLAHELVLDEHHQPDGEFVATIALPHVKPEDIAVEISGDYVSVSASRSAVPAPASPLDATCQCVAEPAAAVTARRCATAAAAATPAAARKEEWSRRYKLPRHTPLESVRAVIDQSREQIYDGEDRVPVATLTLTVPKPQPPASKKLMVTVNPMAEDEPATTTPALAPPATDPNPTPAAATASTGEAAPAAAPPSTPPASSPSASSSPSSTASASPAATTANASDADVINLD